ncbi:MAG: thioredoxin family protein [Coprobacillus sp.]|nr:thioredoxin family protein [Coprobacillus sp.]
MGNLIEIKNLEDYKKAIQQRCILVFSTTWCPDCHFLKTFIQQLVENNPQWTFYYIDRDQMVDLCIELEIMGIPSFIAYHEGKELSRLVNKLRKTQEEIQAFIDSIDE